MIGTQVYLAATEGAKHVRYQRFLPWLLTTAGTHHLLVRVRMAIPMRDRDRYDSLPLHLR